MYLLSENNIAKICFYFQHLLEVLKDSNYEQKSMHDELLLQTLKEKLSVKEKEIYGVQSMLDEQYQVIKNLAVKYKIERPKFLLQSNILDNIQNTSKFLEQISASTVYQDLINQKDDQIEEQKRSILELNESLSQLSLSNSEKLNEVSNMQQEFDDLKKKHKFCQENHESSLNANKILIEYKKQVEDKNILINNQNKERDKLNVLYKKLQTEADKQKAAIEDYKIRIEGLNQVIIQQKIEIQNINQLENQNHQLIKKEKSNLSQIQTLLDDLQKAKERETKLKDQINSIGNIQLKDIQEERMIMQEKCIIIEKQKTQME